MPLIDVSYATSVSEQLLRTLGDVLPDIVAEAVDCLEEPWTGPPRLGDFDIRFRPKSPFDVGGLDCVIEVRTKHFPTRARDSQRRAGLIRDRLAATIEPATFGVWLILSEGAWAQSPGDD